MPVFVVTLFAHGGHDELWRFLAWCVFAVASVTDRIDGDIARKRGLVTEFGKLADPIADKALIGAALIGLSLLGDLPWWITVVMLVREVGVTGLRLWVIRHGVIPASRGGKLKTLLQAVATGLFVLLPIGSWLKPVAWPFMAAAIVVALVTGRRLRRPGRAVAPHAAHCRRPVRSVIDVAALHAHLRGERATVAVAESLTGGLLAAALTEAGGASSVFRGGLVVYATDLKATLAGVDAALLARRGAVDGEVASQLATGVRDRLGATVGIGVTGVAGPDPQDGKPVGTVFASVAGPDSVVVREFGFAGSRGEIRAAAVDACLALLATECGMPATT